ncbi:MAG TPA: hypothetical protein PLQ11_09360 [Beijerinckiaceae bacterium]|nr:hypothetical protein [Beijerinckiaceae bacterium]
MSLPFKLPSPRAPGVPQPVQDARYQLERLYREIGISAVASALHMQQLASPEARAAAERASHEIPPMLRKENAA